LGLITFGFGFALGAIIHEKWVCKNTYIEGRQLKFEGSSGSLWLRGFLLWLGAMAVLAGVAIGGFFALGLSSEIANIDLMGLIEEIMGGDPTGVFDVAMGILNKLLLLIGIVTLAMFVYMAFVWVNMKKWFIRRTRFAD
jgi:hypothetical protein